MDDHRSERPEPSPWRVPVAIEDIADAGQRFALTADAQVRAAVARLAGLRDLPRFEAEFEVTRRGPDGLHVTGVVAATVGQNCVVTLEPLVNEVEEKVDLVFMPRPPAADGDAAAGGEAATAKWDEPEPLTGGVVDLGALATEFLVLGIDPYPRKPGAVFEGPGEREPKDNPFAALAGWGRGRNED